MNHTYKKLGTILLYFTTLFFSFSLQAAEPKEINWQDIPQLKTLFTNTNSQATFVLYDQEKNLFYGYNPQRAKVRYRPASTFKILNSLIAFDTGVVKNTKQIFPYDGKPKALKTWQKEMNISEAIAVSNVPVYQEIARKVGKQRMQQYIDLVNYGNGKIGNQVDSFWLNGALQISAIEQVHFLNGLLHHQWSFSPKSYDQLQQIMPHEKGAVKNSTLYFKTGLGNNGKAEIGWVVGWINSNGKSYPFAMNIDVHNPTQVTERLPLSQKALAFSLQFIKNKL